MTLNFDEWRAGDAQRRTASRPFLVGAEQMQRTRPRSRSEAEFLRRIGTPEHKIGPIRPDR